MPEFVNIEMMFGFVIFRAGRDRAAERPAPRGRGHVVVNQSSIR